MHQTYDFALSFDDKTVTWIIDLLGVKPGDVVLDPFCGTGTTLLECKKRGINSIGIDANPVCVLATKVKTDWHISVKKIRYAAGVVKKEFDTQYADYLEQDKLSRKEGRRGLSPLKHEVFTTTYYGKYLVESGMIQRGWISPRTALKTSILVDAVNSKVRDRRIKRFLLVTLLGLLVPDISNMKYGPEIYRARSRREVDVIGLFGFRLAENIKQLQAFSRFRPCKSRVYLGDSVNGALDRHPSGSIDFLITSPPYPGEHDYTRLTRLELVFGGFIRQKGDLQTIKKRLIRCCTRNVYSTDDLYKDVLTYKQIRRLIQRIESKSKRHEHGFARLYGRVVGEYFGGMRKHLQAANRVLKPGGKYAMVVGDQSSFFSVKIRTAELLAHIARFPRGYFRLVDCVKIRSLRGTTGARRNNFEWLLILEKTNGKK